MTQLSLSFGVIKGPHFFSIKTVTFSKANSLIYGIALTIPFKCYITL